MKLFYILLLGMLLPLPCCAQKKTIDTVRVRFSYAIKGTTTESSKQYDDELSVDMATACLTVIADGRRTTISYGKK